MFTLDKLNSAVLRFLAVNFKGELKGESLRRRTFEYSSSVTKGDLLK